MLETERQTEREEGMTDKARAYLRILLPSQQAVPERVGCVCYEVFLVRRPAADDLFWQWAHHFHDARDLVVLALSRE
jgi:hypothetical protein